MVLARTDERETRPAYIHQFSTGQTKAVDCEVAELLKKGVLRERGERERVIGESNRSGGEYISPKCLVFSAT